MHILLLRTSVQLNLTIVHSYTLPSHTQEERLCSIMTQFVATAASPDFHIRFPTAVAEIAFKGLFVLAHIAIHALTALTVPCARASSSDGSAGRPAGCPPVLLDS